MRRFSHFFLSRYVFILFLFSWGCDRSRDYSKDVKTEVAAENQYKVIGIKDGDTIELLKDGQPLRIRLQGVDCPEKNQDYGTKARQFTSDLVFGKFVNLVVHDTDRYGRTVGEIILQDGRNLNQELVKYGFAWHYTAYSKDPVLAQLQMKAQAEKLGLWDQPNPIAPWDFRKNRGAGATSSPTGSAKAPAIAKTASSSSVSISAKSKLYVCQSKSVKTYHLDQTCSRLKSCKSGIGGTTIALVKNKGLSPCKVCAF